MLWIVKIRSQMIQGIFAVAEQYPDLKANTNFMDLQNQLKKVEEDIANSRKYYNALVREYNDVIMSVPTNIVASLFHPLRNVKKPDVRKPFDKLSGALPSFPSVAK